MATEDPIDFARAAISQVATIACSLGAKLKLPVCGRLGGELYIVADYIDRVGLDQEKRLRLRISKLLRDVEAICNWPHEVPRNGYPLLEAIWESLPGTTSYEHAQTKIQRGIGRLTGNSRVAEEVIAHIQKFTRSDRRSAKRDERDDTTFTKRATRPKLSRYANELTYRTLREQMYCTCQRNGLREQMQREHLVSLLLRPPSPQSSSNTLAQFEMLFSSTPFWDDNHLDHWQDVELLVSNSILTGNQKHARFVDINSAHDEDDLANRLSSKPMRRLEQGQFCTLIGQAANGRLCVAIQKEGLQHCIEPLKQRIDHAPGISLAKILTSNCRLTARMKLVLAYIIAYSVWQYYDSEWMKTQWTSETIHFIKEKTAARDQAKLFTWKPYLAVQFNDKDPQSYEYNRIDGIVHYYPIIRALGIMLVEIGIGRPLCKDEQRSQPLAARLNGELLEAVDCTRDERLWRNFDYPDYMSAARHCLEPGTFDQEFDIEESSSHAEKRRLNQRRNILYDKVVFPLEDLLQGTKWIEGYTKINPLDMPAEVSTIQNLNMIPEDSDSRKISSPKKSRTRSEKDASKWLSRLRGFNRELAQVATAVGLGENSRRVRIAVLDTGYDNNAPFFFSPGVQSRLRGWKDWVDGSDEPEDCHGHGTHLVSLIQNCAPEADIYVARIAKKPSELLKSSENVAKAILWATSEWEVDIISMSFGFSDEQSCISDAIREALYRRRDSILFFAAASNDGANDREMFPARHDSVISIRGTNAYGDFEYFNPPKHENEAAVFGTLGVDVLSAWANSDEEKLPHVIQILIKLLFIIV
ncbi:subtilisin-like protein, partial [Penicillium vulpinum]|uniref:subtilisin-like protein n=1 Tax=Penicillium vulpinum TaxID=29845 RepID=UPI002547B86E